MEVQNESIYVCKAKALDGEWVYGYYVALPDEYTHGEDIVYAIFSLDCEHVCMGEYKDSGWYVIDPNTLCRCTGEKDENENMIYENDIVEYMLYGVRMTSQVIWKHGGFHFADYSLDVSSFIRVCGNIFDNTNLMYGGTIK